MKKRIPWNKGLTKELDNRLKQSVETRDKISKNSQRKSGFYGPHTIESKQKIAKASKGRILTKKVKEKRKKQAKKRGII